MTPDTQVTEPRDAGSSCLHVLLFQEMPGAWIGRGLEHDLLTEARTIGEALRAVVRLVEAHTAFDYRHHRPPLSGFRAAPQSYWNAFTSGTPLPLAQLGIEQPDQWQIVAAIAHRRPMAMAPIRDVRPRAIA
jgi:hypothetical protein